MKKLATLSAVIMGAALLSATPFSLRPSLERIVSLSLDTAAAAKIGATGPLTVGVADDEAGVPSLRRSKAAGSGGPRACPSSDLR